MSTIMHINTEAARLNPESVFTRPADIVPELGLTYGQKRAALRRWADSIKARLAATSEGMRTPPGLSSEDVAMLNEIVEADARLQAPREHE